MAKPIQLKSITISDYNGHADILKVMKNPERYGLPAGANNKVLLLTMLDRYAKEAINRYGSGDSGSGDATTHTHDVSDDSEDVMKLLG